MDAPAVPDVETEILTADDGSVRRAARMLQVGTLVAFPTETVYGLGGDATNADAVAAIYAAKGRPRFNPLICHYADAATAFADAVADDRARLLAASFWPGPLTLVLPRTASCGVATLASAGLDTLAVRVPAHPVSRSLIATAGRPVVAPSANPSGRVSPTRAAHVLAGLAGRIAAVVDAGPTEIGVESTVLDLTGDMPVLLRPGGVSVEAIEAVVGPIRQDRDGERPIASPGMMRSHYAPRLMLRLDATKLGPDEALLGFGPDLPEARLVLNLSPTGDLVEAAARLFDFLHRLDADASSHGLTAIAASPIPQHGIGLAINDRLRRAAAPRDNS